MFSDFAELLSLFCFYSKKILSLFIYPLGLTILLMIAAVVSHVRRWKRSLSFSLIASALIFLFIASTPLTPHILLGALDRAAGDYCDTDSLREKGVRYIVVMAGFLVRPELSPADRWGPTLPRIMEGIRLALALPEATLMLSGGCRPDLCSDPDAMAELPMQCGVQPERIMVKMGALDTAQEVEMVAPLLGSEPFALVTSFTHVPRAAHLFLQRGANPIRCPCERPLWVETPWYRYFVPNATSLKDTTQAMHEYIGMIWTSVILYRGR